MSRRLERTEIQREDGASAVEFALVAPILILLIVGMMQFGFVFNRWLQIEHAAREGVRWASLRNPEADVRSHTVAAAPALDPATLTVVIDPVDPTSALPNTPATVRVSTTVPVFAPLLSSLFGGNTVPLTASATQRIE